MAYSAGAAPQKLVVERFTDGAITCLRFAGILDEDFHGKQLAATIKTPTLVLHLAAVRRLSSFGIREWVNFMEAVQETTTQIILIECAPKVVDQLNMVPNFAGPGLVFSFYAPYRCDYCDSERPMLLQVDRDYEAIVTKKAPQRLCPTCGDIEYLDENAQTYFSHVASQQRFELDPQVAALLASRLSYVASDISQPMKVDKLIEGRSTYLKLVGDLNSSFPGRKLSEGLEGVVIVDLYGLGKIEPSGAAAWRAFIYAVTPAADMIYLLGVPPIFLETLTDRDNLGPKTQVVTTSLPYTCSRCGTSALYQVDVELHYDVVKFATPPEMQCRECKGTANCTANEMLLSHFPELPRPAVPPPIRAFIQAVSERSASRMLGAASLPNTENRRRGNQFLMIVAAAAIAAIVTGAGIFAYRTWQRTAVTEDVKNDGIGKLVEASAAERPAWVTSATPFSAYCGTDSELGLSCVGISTYADNEADARTQAEEAALEALVHELGSRIDVFGFTSQVKPIFSEVRQAQLNAYFSRASEKNVDPGQLGRARRVLSEGRHAVAEALRKSGGVVVPPSPTDQHWERYEGESGFRHLIFVRYQIRPEVLNRLIEVYAVVKSAGGIEVLTAFPGLAWRYPDIETGAVITNVTEGYLKDMGLTERYIVLSVQDRVVKDAPSFERILREELDRLGQEGGTLRLVVKAGDAPPVEYTTSIPKGG